MERVVSLPTLDELCRHVRDVLCSNDQLDPDQTPLEQSVLTRAGRPCGLHFVLRGPRRIVTEAVWAGEENRILFYDSQGRRFAQTRLSESPDPRSLA